MWDKVVKMSQELWDIHQWYTQDVVRHLLPMCCALWGTRLLPHLCPHPESSPWVVIVTAGICLAHASSAFISTSPSVCYRQHIELFSRQNCAVIKTEDLCAAEDIIRAWKGNSQKGRDYLQGINPLNGPVLVSFLINEAKYLIPTNEKPALTRLMVSGGSIPGKLHEGKNIMAEGWGGAMLLSSWPPESKVEDTVREEGVRDQIESLCDPPRHSQKYALLLISEVSLGLVRLAIQVKYCIVVYKEPLQVNDRKMGTLKNRQTLG